MRTHAASGPARALLSAAVLLAACSMLTAPARAEAQRQGKEVVDAVCVGCHAMGKPTVAPKIGDRAAWVPRMSRGLNALTSSAIHGHGAMPARGGMADLTDDEVRGAILYMFTYGMPAAAPAAPDPAPDPRHKLVAGTDVYFGLMPAESVRATNSSGTGADVPSGKGYYHLNISLADHKTSRPVSDAQVVVRVSDGLADQSKPLGLVAANNTVSYGNYFRFESGNAYNITAEIKRPGVPGTIEAKFEYKAP